MPLKIKYTLLLYVAILLTSQAEAIFYKQFASSNTILSGTVYNIIKDSKGFLWFCTPNGILKYDGLAFKTFTVKDGLGDNDIFNLIEDRHGRLWACTYNGNPCFIRNDSVYNSTNNTLLKNLPVLPFINCVADVNETTSYISYKYGQLIKVKNSNFKWIKNIPDSFGGTSLLDIGNAGFRYFCGNKILEIKDDSITKSTYIGNHFAYRSNNKIIITDTAGLGAYYNGKFERYFEDEKFNVYNVLAVFDDGKHHLFIGTKTGLYIINMLTGNSTTILKNCIVTGIARDISGNYRVSTLESGVFYINRELENIQPVGNISESKTYMLENGQFFKATGDTLWYLDKNTGSFLKLTEQFAKRLQPKYFTGNLFFYYDPATFKTYCYDAHMKVWQKFDFAAKSIYTYTNNGLLCLSYHYIYELNFAAGEQSYQGKHNTNLSPTIVKIIDTAYVAVRAFNEKDKLWYISNNVLKLLDYNTGKIQKVDSFINETPVNMFCFDNKLLLYTAKNAYIYNVDGGINKFPAGKIPFLIFNAYRLAEDKYLLNTDKGYYYAALNYHDILRTYLRRIDNPFRQEEIGSLFPYGKFNICNIGGNLYTFPTGLFTSNITKPVVFLKHTMVNNRKFKDSIITIKQTAKCGVKIVVGSLYFSGAEISFMYRISAENYHGIWNEAHSNEINCVLYPGNYKIEYRAVTDNKELSEIKCVAIKIVPPFYMAGTFYIITTLCLLLLCVYIVYEIIRRRRIRFQKELNFLHLENKAINALMNPHFIFNSLNNIQSLINKGSKEKANDYLTSFAKLLRQNIENLQFDFIPLEKELELLKNYIMLQNLRFDDKIHFIQNCQTDNIINPVIPPLLIHTFVENSVVHGFKRDMQDFEIELTIRSVQNKYLLITIVDNGMGYLPRTTIPIADTQKTSLGIAFTKKRLERISEFYHVEYSLSINKRAETAVRKGTVVEIKIYSGFNNKGKELATT